MKKASIVLLAIAVVLSITSLVRAAEENSMAYGVVYEKTIGGCVIDVHGERKGLSVATVLVDGNWNNISLAKMSFGKVIDPNDGTIEARIFVDKPSTYKIDVYSLIGMQVYTSSYSIEVPRLSVSASSKVGADAVEVSYKFLRNFEYAKPPPEHII